MDHAMHLGTSIVIALAELWLAMPLSRDAPWIALPASLIPFLTAGWLVALAMERFANRTKAESAGSP